MAQAFLRAQDIVDIADSELERLEGKHKSDVEEEILQHVGSACIRGFLWWRHIHLTTRAEAEDIFHGRNPERWWSRADTLAERHHHEMSAWSSIRETALGALERGDKKVLMDAAEIARVRKAAPLQS